MSDSPQNTKAGRRNWYGLSLLLHVVAVLALIFLTPIRKVFLEEFESGGGSKSKPSMSSKELSQLAERLEEISEEHIERNVEAMQELLKQMQELNDAEFEEFVVFEHSQIERTPEIVEDNLKEALEAMQQAEELLKKNDYSTAITQQALAESHQKSIQDRLELVQASQEVQQAQEEAAEVQKQAIEAAAEAKKARSEIGSLEYHLRYPTSQIPLLEERVSKAQESVKNAEQRHEESQAKLNEVQQDLASVKAETDDAKKIKREETRLAYATKAVERTEKQLASSEAALEKYIERLTATKTKVTELTKAKAEQEQVANSAHQTATEKQAKAIELQSGVVEKIQEDVAKRVAELQSELGPDETVQAELVEATAVPDIAEMSVLELYNAATAVEQQLAEKFRQGRAMQLSILQDVPFNAALEAVDLVVPVRPEISGDVMTSDARNAEQLEAKKEAVRKAMAETGSMVALGHSLLGQAIQARQGDGGIGAGKISLAAIQARSTQMQQLESLANQETSGKAVDVSQAMMAGLDGVNIPAAVPVDAPVVEKTILPSFGRKVGASGEGAEWMAVTDWYLLGPFDNTGRANIDRVFPPESLVDLNAVYLGKGDRTIRWTFTTAIDKLGQSRPANWESYGIWYAYTELKFDKPCDLWISMGSDDKGQVWINDVPVWISASHHKIWHPGEAQRRVHFEKGRNRVLFRVENGQHGMGFSFWVKLEE